MKLKNLQCVHIFSDGTIELFYDKKDKESDKYISWSEKQEKKMSIFLQDKDYKFKSICLHKEVCNLIKDICSVSIYSKNDSEYTNENNINRHSTILYLKNDIRISFDNIFFDGKSVKNMSVSICY